MGKLTQLHERMQALTGPSTDLDFDVLDLCGLAYHDYTRGHYELKPDGHTIDLGKPWHAEYPTRSIDHAFKLVDRMLNGWRYDLHSPRRGAPWSSVLMEQKESRKIVVGEASTACAAILCALVKALEATNAS